MPVLAALAALLVVGVGAPSAPSAPHVLYRFTDPRIDEASGIAVGVRSPGIDYVQNDSGDSARFFAVDATTGRTAATVTLPGATNVDWEDLAVAPDAAGRSSVWLADTGDNDAVRREVRVYRVDEPRVPVGARDRRVRSGRPDVWRLRYPSGATDAESLAVTPTGTGYLVTKSLAGASVVYRLPPHPDPDRVQTLTRVGAIAFRAHPTTVPLGVVGTLTATGAALSPDGSLLAVRTYADAFVWRVRDGDVAGALRRAPTRVALPGQPQGEGVAFAGRRLLVDSEGVGTAVYAVPLPASIAAAPPATSGPGSPTPTTATPTTAAPTTATPRTAAPRRPVASIKAAPTRSTTPAWVPVGVAGALVLAAAAVFARRRRAR